MITAILTSTFLWININSATFTQLSAIPGITPICAASLLDSRVLNGPYFSMASLGRFPCLTTKMKTHVRLIGITNARP